MTTAATPGIRPLRREEAPRLSAFLRETFMATYAHCSSAANVADFLERQYQPALQSAELADPRLHSRVLIADGDWAGVAQLRVVEDVDGERRGFVSRFYFRAAYQGRGLAQQMLAHLIEIGRRENISALRLSAWKRAPQALRFYEKAGFRAIATADFVVGDEVLEDWLMELAL
jgi:ribosomal protein S18 acetylase RimI-like enzyme